MYIGEFAAYSYANLYNIVFIGEDTKCVIFEVIRFQSQKESWGN